MFPKVKNIENSFRYIRLVSIVVITGSLLTSIFTGWLYYRAMNRAQDKIYVLASDKALEAFAGSRKENIPVEARDHIRSFHHYFFTLDPDEKVITTHITRALYLADGSAGRVYKGLRENGYYQGIVSGNVSQEITIDSISLETGVYPLLFRCYATEKIIRPNSLVTRNLLTEGQLRYTSRSDNDPHGFLIERWVILDNRDLKTEAR